MVMSRARLVGVAATVVSVVFLVPAGGYAGPGIEGAGRWRGVVAAVRGYSTNLPPLASFNGVPITGGGYGSALAAVPGSPGRFYGLTDRGPNVYGPDGEDVPEIKIEPLPEFAPSIGQFRFTSQGRAILERRILLQDPNGVPYSGRINTQASTGETVFDLAGNPLPPDSNGYDPEGLVAAADGTFWVSDEYGPFITHFDATGRQLGRLSPFDGSLPAELARRKANRGMEGLAITPDGKTLVGLMQSGLTQPDLTVSAADVALTRIVTYHLPTGETHEYLYPLNNPTTTGSVATEITALSAETFLVNERDERFPPTSTKALWKIDLSAATDVGPHAAIAGASYDAGAGGLLLGGQTIESLVGDQDAATATATLAQAGVTTVTKHLFLDLNQLLADLDPAGGFFSHDKIEGVVVVDHGRTVVLSNDSDFGLDGVLKTAPPYQLVPKLSPATGSQDDGEFLVLDLTRSI